MILKYDAEIDNAAVVHNLKRITNQIYKLLPMREEGEDWKKPLATLLEELAGIDNLLIDQHIILFPLMSKMEGLFIVGDDDFMLYRRIIFECLGLMNKLIKSCQLKQ